MPAISWSALEDVVFSAAPAAALPPGWDEIRSRLADESARQTEKAEPC